MFCLDFGPKFAPLNSQSLSKSASLLLLWLHPEWIVFFEKSMVIDIPRLVVPPPKRFICWFINPMNTRDISLLYHLQTIVIGVINQLSYRTGAPPCSTMEHMVDGSSLGHATYINAYIILYIYIHTRNFRWHTIIYRYIQSYLKLSTSCI